MAYDPTEHLRAALAALRSRVNEAERERDTANEAGLACADLCGTLNDELRTCRAALETRDAEVARLRDLLGNAAIVLSSAANDFGRHALHRAATFCRGWADRFSAELRTPEATTPAVPEPKEGAR